jgi:hypothetical protein
MIEITNMQKSPIQLIIKSSRALNSYDTIDIPGIGLGQNKIIIAEHLHTEYIDRAEKSGYIKQRILKD